MGRPIRLGTIMAKKPVLTPFEKSALKHVKAIYKQGIPGELQRKMDAMGPATKAVVVSAIKKSASPSRAAKVNKPTKQAKPVETKVRNKRTGKLVTIKNTTPRGSGLRGGMGFGGGSGLRGSVNK